MMNDFLIIYKFEIYEEGNIVRVRKLEKNPAFVIRLHELSKIMPYNHGFSPSEIGAKFLFKDSPELILRYIMADDLASDAVKLNSKKIAEIQDFVIHTIYASIISRINIINNFSDVK